MSLQIGESLPPGFLKMKRGWSRLDYAVQLLVVELAKNQNFKCAFCDQKRDLEIDHDRYPEQGLGNKYTVHNIRGLVCHWHNSHLWFYEINEQGDNYGWEHVNSWISSQDYEDYIDAYHRRLRQLHEDLVEQKCPNYGARRRLLDKFDDWIEGWPEDYPWYWGFEEIKEKRHGKIRTPKQAVSALIACMKFVVEERKKNPNYQPPEEFIKVIVRLKPVLDKLRPVAEAQLKACGIAVSAEGTSE